MLFDQNRIENLRRFFNEQVGENNINKGRKPKRISNRVDINHLMLRVRDEEKKQKKENLIFIGLVSSVVVITGIIASL